MLTDEQRLGTVWNLPAEEEYSEENRPIPPAHHWMTVEGNPQQLLLADGFELREVGLALGPIHPLPTTIRRAFGGVGFDTTKLS